MAVQQTSNLVITRRIASIDVVRGAIMILMALDHVRDFTSQVHFPPEDLSRASAALFFTRWITHFCAPTFFLLAGIGIGISRSSTSAPALRRFLLTRGVWLLFLELILTPIGWRFSFDLLPAFALVLWALGWSMIAMAALISLSRIVVAGIAFAMIFGHNLLDSIQPSMLGPFASLWRVLHVPGFVIPDVLLIAYPLIPWIGVMAFGYVLADLYRMEQMHRRRLLFAVGCGAVVLFIVLRAVNGYGNPNPWTEQPTTALTIASFLNVSKYPPSLMFLLMTLGPALIALAATEQARGRFASWIRAYGRVPLFFYVAHIFVAHALGVLLGYFQNGTWRRVSVMTDPDSIPAWYGMELPGVYLAWAIVVLLLYYPCRQFAKLKDSRSDWWLRYL